MVIRKRFSYQAIHDVLSGLLEEDLHAKRIGSLCNATLGLLHSGRLAICAIGQGLAAARSLKPKHAIKQVDRLLSNPAIEVDDILVRWVPFVVGARTSIVVAMDWTDFDADNQATIMLALLSDHGRSTPLVWLTVDKSTLTLPEDNKESKGDASGELDFHGVKKTVKFHYEAKRTGSDYHIHGTTSINLGDFKIEQPSFAGVHTGMTAEVKVKFKLRE